MTGSTGPRGSFRAWSIVVHGALSFALSILPLLFALTAVSPEVLWRITSAIGAAGAAAVAVSSTLIDFRMTRLGHPPQARTSIRFAQTLSVLATLSLTANLVGWPWPPGPTAYAFGISLVLGSAIIALLHTFLMPVQAALRGEDPEPGSDSTD